jgi:DNA-binding CsgD family transcriptional regulator
MTQSIAWTGRVLASVLRNDREPAGAAVADLEGIAARTPLADSFLACGRVALGMLTDESPPLLAGDELFTAVRGIQVEQANVLLLAALHRSDAVYASGLVNVIGSPVESAYVSVLRALHEGTLAALADDAVAAEQHWYPALGMAAERRYRLLAVDLFEGLAHLAAITSAGRQARPLYAAAQQLRTETGYVFRREPFASWTRDAPFTQDDDAGGDASDWGDLGDWQDVAAWALRTRGDRGRPRFGWESLTPTELQVAALVEEGLSNPQIAARLLMGRATVKTHLDHAYAKLGIHSRAELAAEMARRSRE